MARVHKETAWLHDAEAEQTANKFLVDWPTPAVRVICNSGMIKIMVWLKESGYYDD